MFQYFSFEIKKKLERLPVMLSGGVMSHYATNIKGTVTTYNEAIDMLKAWFTSEEQCSTLLQVWKDTKLSEWFKRSPEESQSVVFREMCDSLKSIQRKLHFDHRKPLFLRDKLISSADIPNIKRALKKSPKNST